MNFDIYFYRIKFPKNKVDKSSQVTSDKIIKKITGTLRNESTILHPTILIKAKEWKDGDNPSNCNYVHIPKFNRYYYLDLKNTRSVRNGMWEIACDVDPLMSWKEDIKSSRAIISKQEEEDVKKPDTEGKIVDNMLVDGTYQAGVDTYITIANFEGGTDTELRKEGGEYYYIVTVLGKPGSTTPPSP